MKKIFGLQKNIFLLGVVSFLNDLSSEMILSVLPAFFTSVLKAGAASLGLVEGVAEAGANFIKIYAGSFSDKIQKRKPFIVLGYSLSVITRPIYLLVSSVAGVVGIRLADRVGKGLREGPRDAIISLSSPADELGKSFGYHRAMDTAGAIVGPLIAFLILRQFPTGFNKVFVTAFIAGIVAVGATLFITDVVGNYKKKKMTLASLALFPKGFKIYLLSLFILAIGSLPVAVMLLKTQSIGLTLASIPLFYVLYNISYSVFSIPGGKLSDKFGPKKIIFTGYLFLIASYIILLFDSSLGLLVVGFLVLGIFPALTDGVQRSYAAMLTDEENRGGAYGLVNAVVGFGALIAGIGGGFIWQRFGPSTAFFISIIVIIIGLVVLSLTKKNKLQ
jgi:MFS family permease